MLPKILVSFSNFPSHLALQRRFIKQVRLQRRWFMCMYLFTPLLVRVTDQIVIHGKQFCLFIIAQSLATARCVVFLT